jgi:hypothetical protein
LALSKRKISFSVFKTEDGLQMSKLLSEVRILTSKMTGRCGATFLDDHISKGWLSKS